MSGLFRLGLLSAAGLFGYGKISAGVGEPKGPNVGLIVVAGVASFLVASRVLK